MAKKEVSLSIFIVFLILCAQITFACWCKNYDKETDDCLCTGEYNPNDIDLNTADIDFNSMTTSEVNKFLNSDKAGAFADKIQGNDNLIKNNADAINDLGKTNPSVYAKFRGKHKILYENDKEGYGDINWANPKLDGFAKEAADDPSFILSMSASDRHKIAKDLLGTGKNWEYGTIFLKALFKDIMGGATDGSDLDFGSVDSATLTTMLNDPELGYDINIQYPDGIEVKIIDGKLIIAGSEIDLDSLKTGSHEIVLDNHKLMIDGKVYAYSSSIAAYLQTLLFLEGTFEMDNIEAANVNYTYIYPDDKIEGDFAEVLSLTNVYLPDGTTQYVGISTQALEGFTILPDGTMISEHADSLSIQFMNLEITDIVNFTLKPDGTLLNQYVAQVNLVDTEDHHSIYTDLDLLSMVTEDATGMTIIGSNAFIESASRVLITRKDTSTGDILIAIIEDAIGLKIFADGTYKFDNATIIRDDYKDVVLENVIGGKLDTLGNYYADHVDSFQFGNKLLTDVTNLEYLPDQLKFVYDSNGILISIAPTDYTIKTDEASTITILDLELNDILESELTIVGNVIVKGNVTSGDENNSFQIHFPTDINLTLGENQSAFWDSRIMPFSLKLQGLVRAGFLNLGYFIAYEPEGNLLAWFELDHVDYEINNGLLVIDKISPTLEDMMSCPNNQTCKINISYNYGFTCGDFPQGGSYQYNHSELDKSFREISQKDAYTICTKKYPSQTFIDYDILNDIPNKATTIFGNMTYERYLEYIMRPVYHGISDNNATMSFSSNLHTIKDLKIERKEIRSFTRHGNFEIIEENSSRYVKVNRTQIAPKAINNYGTFNYTSTIKITDRLYQDNGDSHITIFEPGKGDEEIQRVMDYV